MAHETNTVLVVDDELMVRAFIGEMLRELGYEVCEASSAKAALEVLSRGLPISVMITDIRMPDVTGVELVAVVQKQRPDIHVVYMTGYARETVEGSDHILAHKVLVKPITFAQLEAAMRDANKHAGNCQS